ncbi:AraC family transcriptional regulator [Tunturiibacter gelidiferens]|uniref:helix-turn-helix transcriptional regulator n=1 Tax=Tunturiibacter gelidiferens TaxID=3069689 RepID=UPI003D9BE1B0
MPGSDLVVNRLADVLFIQCLRAHIASRLEACNNGLLRAIFDPQIGVALKSMHEKVDAPWTVETLAAACGMSRSAFAVRFKRNGWGDATGVPDKLENAEGRCVVAER